LHFFFVCNAAFCEVDPLNTYRFILARIAPTLLKREARRIFQYKSENPILGGPNTVAAARTRAYLKQATRAPGLPGNFPVHVLSVCAGAGHFFPNLRACKTCSNHLFQRIKKDTEIEFLDINLTEDSSLLLHAIHSLSTGGFLKKTRLYYRFKKYIILIALF
jgi:hypothetical protein